METYLDSQNNIRYKKNCRLVSVDKLNTLTKPKDQTLKISEDILNGSENEIEKIALNITIHFGDVSQDIPGVQADLESIIRGYLYRTF